MGRSRHRRHAGIRGFWARDGDVLVGLLGGGVPVQLARARRPSRRRRRRPSCVAHDDVPGHGVDLEVHHVGHEPDRALDQTEPAVLGVEPGVQLGELVTHPGAQGLAVGDLRRSMLVMASTPTAERS
jgi:hypothetical protein